MTTGRLGSNIIYTTGNSLSGIGDGLFAHEWGHIGGLDDVRIYTQGIERRRLMYNGLTIGFSRFKARQLNVLATPSYGEFKRAFMGHTTYLKVPKY